MDSNPPKYEEVIQMHDTNDGKVNQVNQIGWMPPTAPLLIPVTEPKDGITITKEPTKREYGPFSFFVNDASNGSCLYNGQVNFKQSATLTREGPDGFIIEIKEIKTPDKFWTFDVIKGAFSMGTIIIDIAKKEIAINTNAMGRNYIGTELDLFQNQDLMVRKNGEAMILIRFPKVKGYEPFESMLEFQSTLEPLTESEKQLFTSVAVACMMARNGPIFTRAEHNFWAGLGYAIALLIVIGIIVGLYYLFDYLVSNCNRPGYSCGKKRY